MLLNKKVVELNGFEREVGIKIEENKMFGVLGQTRFIWAFTEHELPNVEVKEGADKLKAAKYGRLYILKRLEIEGITLDIKTKEKTVEYLHIPEVNGVWINAFENGYLRGCVNGVAFSWHPGLYKMAIAVNEAGFQGAITQKIDTDKIKERLRAAGYSSHGTLMAAVNKSKTLQNSTDAFTKKEEVKTAPSEKFVYVENTAKSSIKLHDNKFLTGVINGKDFTWNSKDGVSTLSVDVRAAIKRQGFDTMTDLSEFYTPVLNASTLNIVNEISCHIKMFKDLQDLNQYIHEGDCTPASMRASITNSIEWINECINVYEEDKHAQLKALNKALDLVNSLDIIEGQTDLHIA